MLSTLHPWSHLNLDFSLQGRPLITNPFYLIDIWMGFPGGAVGKESACQSRRHKRQRFVPWVRKMPWRRKWQLAPVFLSREFHRGAWQATVHGATKCQRLLRAHTHNRYAAAAKSLQLCPTLLPHRRQPTRLPCPWDSPGKNTGVGCHFLLQCRKVKRESEVALSCPTLSDPMDWAPSYFKWVHETAGQQTVYC